jgi:hypothetical protein
MSLENQASLLKIETKIDLPSNHQTCLQDETPPESSNDEISSSFHNQAHLNKKEIVKNKKQELNMNLSLSDEVKS